MYDDIPLTFICGNGAEDWLDEISAEERSKRIIDQAQNGMIILLHDMEGNFRTVQALDTIIPELKRQGYTFVTVSDFFAKCNDNAPKKSDIFKCADRLKNLRIYGLRRFIRFLYKKYLHFIRFFGKIKYERRRY